MVHQEAVGIDVTSLFKKIAEVDLSDFEVLVQSTKAKFLPQHEINQSNLKRNSNKASREQEKLLEESLGKEIAPKYELYICTILEYLDQKLSFFPGFDFRELMCLDKRNLDIPLGTLDGYIGDRLMTNIFSKFNINNWIDETLTYLPESAKETILVDLTNNLIEWQRKEHSKDIPSMFFTQFFIRKALTRFSEHALSIFKISYEKNYLEAISQEPGVFGCLSWVLGLACLDENSVEGVLEIWLSLYLKNLHFSTDLFGKSSDSDLFATQKASVSVDLLELCIKRVEEFNQNLNYFSRSPTLFLKLYHSISDIVCNKQKALEQQFGSKAKRNNTALKSFHEVKIKLTQILAIFINQMKQCDSQTFNTLLVRQILSDLGHFTFSDRNSSQKNEVCPQTLRSWRNAFEYNVLSTKLLMHHFTQSSTSNVTKGFNTLLFQDFLTSIAEDCEKLLAPKGWTGSIAVNNLQKSFKSSMTTVNIINFD